MSPYASVVMVCVLSVACFTLQAEEAKGEDAAPIRVGTFNQETARSFGLSDGLTGMDVFDIAISENDGVSRVYAGTDKGIFLFSGGRWEVLQGAEGKAVKLVATGDGEKVCWVVDGVFREIGSVSSRGITIPEGVEPICLAIGGAEIYLGTRQGLFRLAGDMFVPVEEVNGLLGDDKSITGVASGPRMAVAATGGLLEQGDGGWRLLYPRMETRSWAPHDVRGVAYDVQGRLWFAEPQGVGCRDAQGNWSLFTPEDGVPVTSFTDMAAAGDGGLWFGTEVGAVTFRQGLLIGDHWGYRQGERWLPNDKVRAIAAARNGDVWFATSEGVGVISMKPMTLKEKAAFYEEEIDKYHRRTEYGYVLEVGLKNPGDKSECVQSDSDNDGLWTSMYGAGECFAYAATKDPVAKERAKKAFEALRFLSVVTQGGNPPALPGFVARSILPTSGPDPNEQDYTAEKDAQKKLREDALWKIIHPRWPKSADGEWYWKCDTSSDELDGHYFFYAAYYDLVADTEEERQRVRDLVVSITDHMIEHDFCLVDWDGQPTRWAIYSPRQLNHNPAWFPERGLNSLSMLSYLSVAAHVTGDLKYTEAFNRLVNEHGYAMNMMYPKLQYGPGSNNQSDDEMAFMSFYNLVKYSPGPIVKAMAGFAFKYYWELERFELNPLFNFMYAGVSAGGTFKDPYGMFNLTPEGAWLEQSVDTLMRFPLDRVNWRHTNSKRQDIVRLPDYVREGGAGNAGYRHNGYVLPVDERFFNHWNTDPWELDQGGNGRELADGAVFLLPYYMGLYHGFIVEE